MILSYLLAFTILITSVIQMTDVFIKADQKLNNKQSEFIKETRKTHQSGNITLMAALLTVMLSALLMFFALKFKVELKEARYRKNSYLCFHFLNIKTENYIADMTKFNWALRSAYALGFTGIATAEAEAAIQGITLIRNTAHFYYLKQLVSNNYCEGATEALSYLKNLPYKTNLAGVLETNVDATTIPRGPKWSTIYYKSPLGIRLKKSFALKAEMKMDGAFFPNFAIKTAEVSMPDFSKLKCFFGCP
jgi:hypothetical protein